MSPKPKFAASTNRRDRLRLQLACRLRLRRPGRLETVATYTEDVSCEGFFFTSEHVFSLSEDLECELCIGCDAPDTLSEIGILVMGTAEVVRVESAGAERTFGIACRLKAYTVQVLNRLDTVP